MWVEKGCSGVFRPPDEREGTVDVLQNTTPHSPKPVRDLYLHDHTGQRGRVNLPTSLTGNIQGASPAHPLSMSVQQIVYDV